MINDKLYMSIQTNLQSIQNEIHSINDRKVDIVGVTKNHSIKDITELIEAGVVHIGENRWQEAKDKLYQIPSSVTKHFIGHLQTNKAKEVVRGFDMIQSIDSFKLAKKINDECQKIGKVMPILIQVNTSNEPQKSGIKPEEALNLLEEVYPLPNIELRGLMTIGINSENDKDIRQCFKTLKRLFDKLKQTNFQKLEILSMGMSNDYKIAIEEGSTMVRIGTRLFN